MIIPLVISDKNSKSLKIKKKILNILEKKKFKRSNLIIVVGGDGFMLQTLKKFKNKNKLFYGINSGNYGFLMNKFSTNFAAKNLLKCKLINISPLEMIVFSKKKKKNLLQLMKFLY